MTALLYLLAFLIAALCVLWVPGIAPALRVLPDFLYRRRKARDDQ